MWSHCFLPSLPLSVSLPPFLSEKDPVSSPFKSVLFNLDCALESPGKLDQILMPRPGPGPMNSDSLGKGSGNSIFKSPWLIPTCSQDQQALTTQVLGNTVYSLTYTRLPGRRGLLPVSCFRLALEDSLPLGAPCSYLLPVSPACEYCHYHSPPLLSPSGRITGVTVCPAFRFVEMQPGALVGRGLGL